MTSADPVLERLFEDYCVATARAAAPAAPADAVTALLTARLALFEHLVADGWDPPREVQRQIGLDARALRVPAPTARPQPEASVCGPEPART